MVSQLIVPLFISITPSHVTNFFGMRCLHQHIFQGCAGSFPTGFLNLNLQVVGLDLCHGPKSTQTQGSGYFFHLMWSADESKDTPAFKATTWPLRWSPSRKMVFNTTYKQLGHSKEGTTTTEYISLSYSLESLEISLGISLDSLLFFWSLIPFSYHHTQH